MYYVIVYVHPCTKNFGSVLCLLDVFFIIGIIYTCIIVEEKEREEEQAVAGIGFYNGLFEYGTTTPLPTITTDNGFEKGEREYGFGFGTVAVVVALTITTQIGFNNVLYNGYEYDIGVTPAAPVPVLRILWFGTTNGFKE